MDRHRAITQKDKQITPDSEARSQEQQMEEDTLDKTFTQAGIDAAIAVTKNKWMNRTVGAESIKKRSMVKKDSEEQNNAHVISLWFEVRDNSKEAFNACQIIIKKNLWFLDGSKELNGEALLSAKEYKEEI